MKFIGTVGFWEPSVEVKPGIYKPTIVEKVYVGDILRDYRKFQQRADYQNDEFTISNQMSILADLYAYDHLASIRYIIYNGTKWKVNNVEMNYPRLILEIGGVYNENKTGTS